MGEAAVWERVGRDPCLVQFDCMRTWVYPGGRAEARACALHHDLVGVHGHCLCNQMSCAPLLSDPLPLYGQIVGRFDGLGISPLALLAGDVLVQRHCFAAPPEGEMWLRASVYWGDTMERWTVLDTPGADASWVRLED